MRSTSSVRRGDEAAVEASPPRSSPARRRAGRARRGARRHVQASPPSTASSAMAPAEIASRAGPSVPAGRRTSTPIPRQRVVVPRIAHDAYGSRAPRGRSGRRASPPREGERGADAARPPARAAAVRRRARERTSPAELGLRPRCAATAPCMLVAARPRGGACERLGLLGERRVERGPHRMVDRSAMRGAGRSTTAAVMARKSSVRRPGGSAAVIAALVQDEPGAADGVEEGRPADRVELPPQRGRRARRPGSRRPRSSRPSTARAAWCA